MSEQFLNGTSAHIRLFSAIHSFSAIHGMVYIYIKVGYNQSYLLLATVKIKKKYILKSKKEKNGHKNMNMKDKSVKL